MEHQDTSKPKLKLKETPHIQEPSFDWSQSRYAKPEPPTVLQRFYASAKRFLRVILIVAVILAAFLLIPFRRWDDYVLWQQLQDALITLSIQPDSLPNIQRVSAIAATTDNLWNKPNGPRPEKWYQFGQLAHYDANYGLIQVLALALIRHENESLGLKKLRQLQLRTSFSTSPDLLRIDTCRTCQGRGVCNQCKGKGTITTQFPSSSTFPLKKGLGGTTTIPSKGFTPFNPKEVQKKCPQCNGTKKCRTCEGNCITINYKELPALFQDSIKCTIAINKKAMFLRHAIHMAASLQQIVFGKSGELTKKSLLGVPNDTGKANDKAISDDDITTLNPNEIIRLKQACENLKKTPLSKPNLKIVLDVARYATNSPNLRSATMTAVALSRLLQGDTNAFIRISQIQKTTFTNQPQLLTVTADDYTATCEDCHGKGVKVTPCPRCMAPNKCTKCKGTRRIATEYGFVPCDKCNSKELCKMCNGGKYLTVRCFSCKGVGTVFALSNNVHTNYINVLSFIAKMCRDVNKE